MPRWVSHALHQEGSALSDDFFSSLGLLAEVLAASALPGSFDLISRMLDALSCMLHYESPAQADKSYVKQLLMSVIYNAAQKVDVSLFPGRSLCMYLRSS